MPRKNTIKIYSEGAYYHLYNRGVEKRKIFLDEQDYRVFLFNLKKCLLEEKEWERKPNKIAKIILGELSKEIDLLAYCLLPNHFHLLVRQSTSTGITKLMKKVITSYSMYFNKRYNRVGSLFQGIYKAVMVKTDEQLLHLSRYIHLNPLEISEGKDHDDALIQFPFSSYSLYLGSKRIKWVKPEEVLAFFKTGQKTKSRDLSYQSFVESGAEISSSIGKLILE